MWKLFIKLVRGLWAFSTKPFNEIKNKTLDLYYNIKSKVNQDIRWELIVIFGVCLSLSFIFFTLTNSFFSKPRAYSEVNYQNSIREMSNTVLDIGYNLDNKKISIKNGDAILEVLNNYNHNSNKILIVDESGKVMYKTDNAEETNLDMHAVIRNAMNFKNNYDQIKNYDSSKGEFITFYPVGFSDSRAYAVLKGTPRGDVETKYYTQQKSFFALVLSVIFFIVSFYFITGKKVRYIQEIALGVMYIARGQLNFRIEQKGEDELANLAQNINFMTGELRDKIEKERELEKTKGELITNVSHDLRTPLTSILGYLNLIKDSKYNDKEEMMEYIDIAYNKSEKLKILIDELFEYTKITSDGIKLNLTEIALTELIEQLTEEFVPIFEENKINVTKNLLNESIKVTADGDKLARVFENLIVNAIRYSYKPGDIKITLEKIEDYALFSISNRGDNIKEEDLNKIFERFYRLEKSRAEITGGSGLGLAISKSIINLHGGEIWAESKDNIVTFFVKISTK
ncbi:HAMP domain-containing sensor histidine kinase [uncultured Clostridium sp.]|uniref:sensor histidine kinase n=1 Tax=uncultured Clostridium sp. TaxID=59620 RepID=UPI0028EF3E58|nr:HAMP domain-containing sensor histidine kinase [uncultured Clostridium sp.]